MKEKQFEPGKNNLSSPAPGLAAVNTHNPDEETVNLKDEERVRVDHEEREEIPADVAREGKGDSSGK